MRPQSERGRTRHAVASSTRPREELRVGVDQLLALGSIMPDRLRGFEVLEAAQRSGVLVSATGWREVMRARNVVAHESAMSPEEAARALDAALAAAESAGEMLDRARAVVARPPYATWIGEAGP